MSENTMDSIELSDKSNVLKRKFVGKVSKSGRQIKVPKILLTTSSEENTPRRTRKTVSIDKELGLLENIAKKNKSLISTSIIPKLDLPILTKNKKPGKLKLDPPQMSQNSSPIFDQFPSLSRRKNSLDTLKDSQEHVTARHPASKDHNSTFLLKLSSEKDVEKNFNASTSKSLVNELMAGKKKQSLLLTIPSTSKNEKLSTSLESATSAKISVSSLIERSKKSAVSSASTKQPSVMDPKGVSNSVQISAKRNTKRNRETESRNSELDNPHTLSQKAFQQKVIDCLEILISGQKKILHNLNDRNRLKKDVNLYGSLKGFPLNSFQEFMDFENSDKKVNQLYSHLKTIGGSKLREALSFYLREAMTDELISKFTWLGDENHGKLRGAKLVAVIYLAATECRQFKGPITREEFKDEFLEVIRSAKQRYKKSKQRKETAIEDFDKDMLVQIQNTINEQIGADEYLPEKDENLAAAEEENLTSSNEEIESERSFDVQNTPQTISDADADETEEDLSES